MTSNLYLWNVDSEGGWSDAANWVNADSSNAPETAAPSKTSAVEITQGTVDTLAAPITVASLVQTQTGVAPATTIDGSGNLVVSGTASFKGAIAQTGSGTTELEGATIFDDAVLTLSGGRALDNLGTFTFTGAADAVRLGDATSGGTFDNAKGAQLNLVAGAQFVDENGNLGQAAVVNAGGITLASGQDSLSAVFTNAASGVVGVGFGATLDFSPALTDAFAGSIVGAGAISFGGSAASTSNIDFEAGLKLTVANMIVDADAVVTAEGPLTYNGELTLNGGALVAGAGQSVVLGEPVKGSGQLDIAAGATLTLDGAAATGVDVSFDGGAGTLSLQAPSNFSGAVEDVGAGSTIFLKSIIAASVAISRTDDELVLSNNGQPVAHLQLSNVSPDWVVSTKAKSGGTLVEFAIPTMNVTQYVNGQGAIPPIPFEIVDTAAQISAAMADDSSRFTFVYGNLAAIEISDNLPVALTLSQLALDDPSVLALKTASGAPYQLALSGTAAQLDDDLVAIDAIGAGHIQSIAITGGGPLAVTVAQWQANAAIYERVSGGVEIQDTTANILANLGALGSGVNIVAVAPTDSAAGAYSVTDSASSLLQSLGWLETEAGAIASITDTTKGALAVSAAQFAADAAALALTVNAQGQGQTLAVAGTAARLSQELSALNADTNVVALTVSDGGKVDVSLAQYAADSRAIGLLTNGRAHVAIEDSLANLDAAVGGAFSSPAVASVVVVDSYADIVSSSPGALAPFRSKFAGYEVQDTVADFVANAASILSLSPLLGVEIVDSAGAIEQNLAALKPQARHIVSLASNDGVVDAGIQDLLNYSSLLDAVSGGFDLTLAAGDLFKNMTQVLQQAGYIDSIALLTGPLAVSVSTFAGDQTALDRIAGGVSIADTAGNLQPKLASLQADAKHIVGISLTSGAVSVSVATFEADTAALDRIGQGYSIKDAGAALSGDFADLAASDEHIDSIAVAGTGTQTINITSAEQIADANLLSKITGPYVLNVTGGASATTTGDTRGLTLVDTQKAGDDILTGGGAADTFVLLQGFGHATITDFAGYLAGASSAQDHIELSKAEFSSSVAGVSHFQTLLNDAQQVGANVVITAGADTLTLEDVALAPSASGGAALKNLAANFSFV